LRIFQITKLVRPSQLFLLTVETLQQQDLKVATKASCCDTSSWCDGNASSLASPKHVTCWCSCYVKPEPPPTNESSRSNIAGKLATLQWKGFRSRSICPIVYEKENEKYVAFHAFCFFSPSTPSPALHLLMPNLFLQGRHLPEMSPSVLPLRERGGAAHSMRAYDAISWCKLHYHNVSQGEPGLSRTV